MPLFELTPVTTALPSYNGFQMIYLWKQDLLSIVEIKPYTEKYIHIFTYISSYLYKISVILENRRNGAVPIWNPQQPQQLQHQPQQLHEPQPRRGRIHLSQPAQKHHMFDH